MMFRASDMLPVLMAEGSPAEVVGVAERPGAVVTVAAGPGVEVVAMHGRYAQLTARDVRGADTSLAAQGTAEAPHAYLEPGTFRR